VADVSVSRFFSPVMTALLVSSTLQALECLWKEASCCCSRQLLLHFASQDFIVGVASILGWLLLRNWFSPGCLSVLRLIKRIDWTAANVEFRLIL
jgi:hypothetical protein